MTAQRKPSIATRVSAGLRAFKSVGESVRSVKIAPDGEVTFLTGPHEITAPSSPVAGDLDAELAAWDRKHGYG